MDSSSNSPDHASSITQETAYLNALNTNVSNLVSVKLSGYGNYDLWKTQMLCLLVAHGLDDLLHPDYSQRMMGKYGISLPEKYDHGFFEKYDNLLKGWIFRSVSEDVLRMIIGIDHAYDVWATLEYYSGSIKSFKEDDSVPTKREREETIPTDRTDKAKKLLDAMVDGSWEEVHFELISDKALTEKINSDGDTILHLAVDMGRNDVIRTILWGRHLDLSGIKNSDGCTLLHVAANVGNTDAAEFLVKEHKNLLFIQDNKDETALEKALKNMHFNTIATLIEATEAHEFMETNPTIYIGIDILMNAIFSKQYDFALQLLILDPLNAVVRDDVLMAIARNFPGGLDYWETLIYPSLDNMCERILKRTKRLFHALVLIPSFLKEVIWRILSCQNKFQVMLTDMLIIFVVPGLGMGYLMHILILLLLWMVYFPFFILYFLLWKAAATKLSPIKNIEQRKKKFEQAKKVVELVCQTIIEEFPDQPLDLYTGPILEAACQDAYEVVDEILCRCPEAILCVDKNGHDIIQLATIHRSEKIYNLVYIIGKSKIIHRTLKDYYKNNMLHLAGRLAPSNKLKRITGAALQLQRELQWHQEVEKFVHPTCVNEENVYMETPDMVFTREHENLVKEGEQWFKTVAESCSITAALITTVVFAAAITVPGGSNQETGVPLFLKEFAFGTFAIADAISLVSSTTALLVFLSILTARFAEQDFLVRLPTRLFIGLCALLLSVTAMMVAFSATLFLVFSRDRLWVLAPICGVAFIPIAVFLVLQFPLILDLFLATYISKFGKSHHNSCKFNVKDVEFYLGQKLQPDLTQLINMKREEKK